MKADAALRIFFRKIHFSINLGWDNFHNYTVGKGLINFNASECEYKYYL